MILQALVDYYDRKAADPDSEIAPLGWEWKEIPFVIVVDCNGKFVNIEDTREQVGKKKFGKKYLVPQAVKRTVGIAANILWDNAGYVLGIAKPTDDKEKNRLNKTDEDIEKEKIKEEKLQKRAKDQFSDFVNRLKDFSDIAKVKIVRDFLLNDDEREKIKIHETYPEIEKCAVNLTFKIEGDGKPVCNDPAFSERYDSNGEKADTEINGRGICLVSGNVEKIAICHPAIKGVRDAQSSGANIISFNAGAFCSFSKKQGMNSPIGEKVALKYTTALNTLLGKESKQKLQIGDATTVFWSDKKTSLEENYADWFSEPEKDNPDALTKSVAELLSSVESGAYRENTEDAKFFVLGLSPNAARISVRFWHAGTVWEMSSRIAEYFKDLRICHGDKLPEHLSLWRLLVSIAPLGKTENIPPNLAGEVMRSIMEGLPFPETLLSSAVRRCKVEADKVSYPRAKIIKGCLNRKIRFNNPNNERKMEMSLDRDNTNIGYRLGRLFATLEKCQEEANPGINATIKDRYYSSASSSPSTVFASLLRLNNHHLAKIGGGRKVNLEKLVQEITSEISDFPSHLAMDDQGRFAIGYYHQRQDFFTKKSDSSND